MVPNLERDEFMYEPHQIADNIVMERCKHSEVQGRSVGGVAESSKDAAGLQDEQPPNRPPLEGDSPSILKELHVEPVIHIPMTQEKSLQELPSQLDFDWTESATPATPATARNLSEEHHVVDTFVQVSQIAHEAIADATQQPPGTDSCTV